MIGRWLSPDPYAQHWSPYLAMSNNPVSFIDPDGGQDGNYDSAMGDVPWWARRKGHVDARYMNAMEMANEFVTDLQYGDRLILYKVTAWYKMNGKKKDPKNDEFTGYSFYFRSATGQLLTFYQDKPFSSEFHVFDESGEELYVSDKIRKMRNFEAGKVAKRARDEALGNAFLNGLDLLTRESANLAVDEVPVVGSVKAVAEAAVGKDALGNEVGPGHALYAIPGLKLGGKILTVAGALYFWVKRGKKKNKLIKKGTTVLGKYPKYLQVADDLNARRFNIPPEIWNKMTPDEQWAANVKFLERTIARGDNVILADPIKSLDDVSGYLRKELDYLIDKGYSLSSDGTKLIKP